MILWCDGVHDPAENMRRDARLLERAAAGGEPVLRLFGFAPHGITLGLAQRAERELDLARCAADGVPWAVRPTGGRAIFHAEEWTYAFACPLADPGWGGTLAESYARVSELVLRSLVRLGVPASGAGGRSGASLAPRARTGAAPPCFASTARHEIVLGERKLVGSAQRRRGRALLQQGSVLLGPGHLRLADYLALGPAGREATRQALERSAADAGRWLGAGPPLARWADALGRELPAGVRRLDGGAGAFLLTPEEDGSYTAPSC